MLTVNVCRYGVLLGLLGILVGCSEAPNSAAAATEPVDLAALAKKLGEVGRVTANPFLVRLEVDEYQLTVFADGRTIVGGTDDPAVARTMHAKFIGG
ncbi:MAG: hypothetical protein IH898_15210 [Planctomycetes bacterium]|nr:hypothetical protein [Planctomycetota bacterium]